MLRDKDFTTKKKWKRTNQVAEVIMSTFLKWLSLKKKLMICFEKPLFYEIHYSPRLLILHNSQIVQPNQ
jgi:hypothetical protein